MSKLFQCDKCEKQTTEPIKVWVAFERTPEEIQELMAAADAPLGTESKFKEISIVRKQLDLCRACYDELKEAYL